MNSKKLYFLLVTIVALLAIGLIGSAYGANSLLQAQSKKLVEVRSESAALDLQQTQLSRAKKNIATYQPVSDIARSIVPQDKDQAQTVRELVDIAAAHSIKLSSVTFPSSTLGGDSAPGAAASAADKGKANLSQLKPVPAISGVYSLNIVVQSDSTAPISFTAFTSFLNDLEHNRRTALVSGITLQPDAKDPSKLAFTLNLDEYVKP